MGSDPSASLSFLLIGLMSIDFSAGGTVRPSGGFYISSSGDTTLRQRSPFRIWCNVTNKHVAKSHKNLTVSWWKNGVELDTESQADYIASPSIVNGTAKVHHSLTIKTGDILMAGDYKCLMTNENQPLGNKTILVYSPPYPASKTASNIGPVHQLASQDTVEGHSVALVCDVLAHPPVTYQWSSSKGHIHNNSRIITLENLKTDDRDYYSCLAANRYGNVTLQQLIRVKSRWAPLWPAIGIVLIMVTLVTIIAISEKRRKAQEDLNKDK